MEMEVEVKTQIKDKLEKSLSAGSHPAHEEESKKAVQ